jgi:hypothetical protein
MQATSKPVRIAVNSNPQASAATFKTSLHAWQARWKARRAAEGRVKS